MFGQEAGLFCPSGTMTNQIAIKMHTQPMDEVICHKLSHIYNYETAGWAVHSGVSIRLLEGDRGRMRPEDIENAVLPYADWYPNSKLVVAENTVNKGGGSFYDLERLQQLRAVCTEKKLKFHLDGARVFNAIAASGVSALEMGSLFDSVSICLSKGLGAPIGSLLLGKKEDIRLARKIRKLLGGGMRQAGIIAAAGIFALEKNTERLTEDHRRAKVLAAALADLPFVETLEEVDTNLVIFKLKNTMSDSSFVEQMAAANIQTVAFSPQLVRLVTHLDFDDEMLEHTLSTLKNLK